MRLFSNATIFLVAALAKVAAVDNSMAVATKSKLPDCIEDLGLDTQEDDISSCRSYCSNTLGYDNGSFVHIAGTHRCMCKSMADSTLLAICQTQIEGMHPEQPLKKLARLYKEFEEAKHVFQELLTSFKNEDEDAPPGPPGGWPHVKPFFTTVKDQMLYNDQLDAKAYASYREVMFQSFGEKNALSIHLNQIARPEGSTTGYYTGVTHFNHVNNPSLVTFLFSAGRHDGGSNTYLTIDTSSGDNPFRGAQEKFINETNVSTYTWVSSFSRVDSEGTVNHFALFSGGSGSGVVGASILYLYQENEDGSLQVPPAVEWIENVELNPGGARFGLLSDLGNIYDDDGNLVSVEGVPDIIISGCGGLFIYSNTSPSTEGSDWVLTRSILISDLDDDTSSFVGVAKLDGYLIVTARSRWNPDVGVEFNAPCLVYDYQNDVIVQRFAGNAQTVSAAVIDDKKHVLIGAGGEEGFTGEPNLMFDVLFSDENAPKTFLRHGKGKTKSSGTLELELSNSQIAFGMPLNYTVYEEVDDIPVSTEQYFVVPAPGLTRTRQVLPFHIPSVKTELILEINSGETCNLYKRDGINVPATKIMPLLMSEGVVTNTTEIEARAGDTLLIGDKLFVILAMFNGNNTVYSFDSKLLM